MQLPVGRQGYASLRLEIRLGEISHHAWLRVLVIALGERNMDR